MAKLMECFSKYGCRLNKYQLYRNWLDLAAQHYRANNAREFFMCVRQAHRVRVTYLDIN